VPAVVAVPYKKALKTLISLLRRKYRMNHFITTCCHQMSHIHAINMGAQEKPNTSLVTVAAAMTKQSVILGKSQTTAKMKALS
jgi:hypothetical protein